MLTQILGKANYFIENFLYSLIPNYLVLTILSLFSCLGSRHVISCSSVVVEYGSIWCIYLFCKSSQQTLPVSFLQSWSSHGNVIVKLNLLLFYLQNVSYGTFKVSFNKHSLSLSLTAPALSSLDCHENLPAVCLGGNWH